MYGVFKIKACLLPKKNYNHDFPDTAKWEHFRSEFL